MGMHRSVETADVGQTDMGYNGIHRAGKTTSYLFESRFHIKV